MTRLTDRIADVRTYLPVGGKEGGDYHGRGAGHWIVDTVICNPMSVYPEYKVSRLSRGIDAIGGLVVLLASDAARYVNGASILVDGGMFVNLQ